MRRRNAVRGTFLAVTPLVVLAVPAALLRSGTIHAPVELATLLFGISVVAAAFAMSWASEAAEHDVPRALSLLVVALIAVLPEYAVDIIFAWKAGHDPSFAPFAAANMTGSNRLLVGLGWSTVAVLAWISRGTRSVRLDRGDGIALAALAVATVYSLTLPLRSGISILDSILLVALFSGYALWAVRSEMGEPDLVGPAAAIGALGTVGRRLVVIGLFAFAGTAIALAAEPFADGLVRTGAKLGIDQFLLVQWLAPLASESPEFIVAGLIAFGGKPTVALALLLSAKVNQWTLLIGSLPVAFSVGAGAPGTLPLDGRQSAEVLLTAAQSLFGIAVLASMTFSLGEAALLSLLFFGQLIVGGVLRTAMGSSGAGDLELYAFSVLYVVLATWKLLEARRRIAVTVMRLRARLRPGRA